MRASHNLRMEFLMNAVCRLGIRPGKSVVNVAHHVFIDVVRDEKDVVFLAEITDHVDLVALIHLPQRVVWVVVDDSLRLRVEQVGQLGRIQLPVGRRRHAVFLRLRSRGNK